MVQSRWTLVPIGMGAGDVPPPWAFPTSVIKLSQATLRSAPIRVVLKDNWLIRCCESCAVSRGLTSWVGSALFGVHIGPAVATPLWLFLHLLNDVFCGLLSVGQSQRDVTALIQGSFHIRGETEGRKCPDASMTDSPSHPTW